LEVQTMKETMNLLKGKEGERYLEYMKIMSLNSNVQELTVVPSTVQKLIMK
jgi:hypothetical protein